MLPLAQLAPLASTASLAPFAPQDPRPVREIGDWRCELLAPSGLAASSAGTSPPAGDFVVSIPRPGGLDVIVGDVVGHGPAAAAEVARYLAALERIGWLRPDAWTRDPGGMFEAWNREAMKDGAPERFATALLLRFELSGRVTVVDAGHAGTFLARPGRAAARLETLPPEAGSPSGIPLGVLPASRYRSQVLELEPGAVVVATTDGIWEARDGNRGLLGSAGVERLLDECRVLPVRRIPAAMVKAARTYAGGRLGDDAICVAVAIGERGTGHDDHHVP